MDPLSQFRLDGKVVVLTGGSGLIGAEAAKQLPRLGARLFVGVRDTAAFQRCLEAANLPDDSIPPLAYPLDIADPSSIETFLSSVESQAGRIDVLINNAWPRTSDWGARFEEVPSESLYKNLCDHAGGYFLCCQGAARRMQRQGGGVILNMGSIYGAVGPHFPIYEGTPMTSAAGYSLIKGGIHTFTKYLATYLAPDKIRVNCLSPGGIRNDSTQHPAFRENYERNTPLGRMAQPDDIVGPLIFLISDASRYVTGVVLMVDGGWTAW
jgi:NAD(P)-dependent dehydrogenase (short-subunit alcohol dehydrogenase family)